MAMPELEEEPEPEPEPIPEPEPEPEPEPVVEFEDDDDVLELTDDMLLEEPKPAFDMSDMQAIMEEAVEPEPVYQPPPRRAAPLPPIDDPLMDELPSERGSNAFTKLVRAVARDRAILLGNGGLTIEELVREILRPILKDWLDENLPYMIERIVKQEIEKMVNRIDNFE